MLGRALARPGVTIAGAVFAALMTGIVANAILFQKGHHPAPLFNGGLHAASQASVAPQQAQPRNADPMPSAAQATTPIATIVPPVAPIVSSAPGVKSVSAPLGTPVPLGTPAPSKHKSKPATTHKDALGSLIGSLLGKPKTSVPTGRPRTGSQASTPPRAKSAVAKTDGQPHV